MTEAYVYGGTYRDADDRVRGRFRLVNPFLTRFWERDEPLRVFTNETLLPALPERCHLYRIQDPLCVAVELAHENAEWVDRVGAPGVVFLAESARESLYRAYCRFAVDGDHG